MGYVRHGMVRKGDWDWNGSGNRQSATELFVLAVVAAVSVYFLYGFPL